MSGWARTALWSGLFALIGGAVVAVFLLPSVIDWNDQKPRFVSALEGLTGLDIEIEGPLDVSLIPEPRIAADRVVVKAVGGARVLTVDLLDARVSLWPLLVGRLDIADLRLVRPTLHIGALSVPRRLQSRPLPVTLSDVLVEDGRVSFGYGGARSVISVPVGTLRSDPEAGDVRFSGEALVNDLHGSLDVRASILGRSREIPLSLQARLPDAASHVRFDGTLAHDGARGRLGMEASGVEIAARISPETDGHALSDVEIGVRPAGEADLPAAVQQLRGKGFLALTPSPGLTLALTGRRLQTEAASRLLQLARSGLRDFGSLPVDLALEIDRVELRGAFVRAVRTRLAWRDSDILVHEAEAGLPGDARVRLVGRLSDAAVPDAATFGGRVSVSAPRLRETFRWLGIAPASAAPDALRFLEGEAALRVAKGHLNVSEIEGSLDGVSLSGTFAARQREGRCELAIDGSIASLDTTALGILPLAGADDERRWWQAVAGRCDASLTLEADSVATPAQRFGRLVASADVIGAAADISLETLATPAGGTLSGSIQLSAIDTVSRLSSGRLRLNTPDLGRDLAAIGLPTPRWAEGVELEGFAMRFDHDARPGILELEGRLLESQLRAEVEGDPTAPRSVAVVLENPTQTATEAFLDSTGLATLAARVGLSKPVSAEIVVEDGRFAAVTVATQDRVLSFDGIAQSNGLQLEGLEGWIRLGDRDQFWRLDGRITPDGGVRRMEGVRFVAGALALEGEMVEPRPGHLEISVSDGEVPAAEAHRLVSHLPAIVEGRETISFERLRVDGKISRTRLFDLPLRQVRFLIQLDQGGFALDSLVAFSGTGRVEVSGGLLRRGEGEPPVARLSLDLMAIPLRPVLSRLMPLDLQATGGLSGEVSGTLRSGHPLEEISGELRVETGPGRLSGIETLAPLEPEFAQDGVVFFDRLEGEFALTEQGILLRDFTLVRGDLSARVTALLDRETRRLRGAVEIRDAAGDVRRLPLGD